MPKVFHDSIEQHLYNKWRAMKMECRKDNGREDSRYYSGVSVCPEWMSFECFFSWAKSSGYEEGAVLARKDKSKGFSPENCFFTTKEKLQSTRTNNRKLTCHGGEYNSIEEFARSVNINSRKIQKALEKGKSPEEIVARRTKYDKYVYHGKKGIYSEIYDAPNPSKHARSRNFYKMYDCPPMPLGELVDKYGGKGVTRVRAQNRLDKGWTIHDAVTIPVESRK